MCLFASLSGEYLNLFLGGVFGMLLLSILLVVFFVVYQRRLFAQERLREEKEKEHQKALLTAAVEVQEMERRRIARDLHDEIGSLLSATRLYIGQFSPDVGAEKLENIKKESLSIVDDMIQNTRRITHDLLPPTLEKFGFQAATEDLCGRINKSGGMKVEFQSTTELRPTPKAEVALYRVLQELLNNTMKHARASKATVELYTEENTFNFIYKDDGKGFDLSKMKSKGLGLLNMESRIALTNGAISFETNPGEGFKVNVALPVRSRTSPS